MSRAEAGARPPRVLQVVLSLHPGGTERLLIELVTAAERGHADGSLLPGRARRLGDATWSARAFV